MKPRALRWTIFALGLPCLLLMSCKQKHDPLKPTVAPPVVVAA